MCSHIFWRGSYSREQLRLLEQTLSDDSTFVDVGANRGEFSIAAALKLREGRVVSFEPHPRIFDELLRNVAINELTNVQAIQIGLADRSAEAQLFEANDVSSDGSWNAGLGTIHEMRARQRIVAKIKLAPLDVIREELDLRRIDVMKIDVEGAELSVLRGAADAISDCKPIILMEVNEESCRSAGYPAQVLLDWLRRRGYDIRLIDRRLSLPRLSEAPVFCNVACFPRQGRR
jgi:FkbM family methyltransferase